MKRWSYILLLIFLCFDAEAQTKDFRIMCYNVENLFDCKDDSLTKDDEFTPTGLRAWGYKKYQTKVARVAKVISAVGEGIPPFLVGLCEIENEKVLEDLVLYSPLKNYNYKWAHFESLDARGVDVALLYQRTIFRPIETNKVQIRLDEDTTWRTRDVLYVKGIVMASDTLHVMVCHFPSRLGGELESEWKRMGVAKTVRGMVDSIMSVNGKAKILIMGDFNDYPKNRSLYEILGAKEIDEGREKGGLYNLMLQYCDKPNVGTHKFQEEWGCLDQMIVSGALLNEEKNLWTKSDDVKIFDAAFLLEEDEKWMGMKPFRTFIGMKYHGGFSDHLPIYLDVHFSR